MFDMPIMIHKFHMGNRLTKTGYNFDGVKFNEKVYTQDVTNCRKCHSADTPADLAATPQGNNWKDKPSRLACGSCHDGINWTETVRRAATSAVRPPTTPSATSVILRLASRSSM